MIASQDLTEALISRIRQSEKLHENSITEYKVQPHSKKRDCELLKDILGLLNSFERPTEDRWLIYGIADADRKAIGFPCSHPDLLDDANYQEKFAKISPTPMIEFLTVNGRDVFGQDHADQMFAAFYIPAENFGKVYELSKPVEDGEAKSSQRHPKRYSQGVSFVRIGSRTDYMHEEQRQKIRSTAKNSITNPIVSTSISQVSQTKVSSFNSLMLLGAWDDHNPRDRELIEELSGVDYAVAVQSLHNELESGAIGFENPNWQVKDRVATLAGLGRHLTDAHLVSLVNPLSRALTSVSMDYVLVDTEDDMSTRTVANPGCSRTMRLAAASFCACISNNRNLTPLCTDEEIDRFLYSIMHAVFDTDDWKVIASSDSALPLLAEASPSIYLDGVEFNLQQRASIKGLFRGRTSCSAPVNLGPGLVRGLQIAAIEASTFAQSFNLLIALSDMTAYAKDAIVRTLLPWLPQTKATPTSRKGAGLKLAKNPSESTWQAFLDLLPNRKNQILYDLETKYMDVPDFAQTAKNAQSKRDIIEIGRQYGQIAIAESAGKAKRMTDLVDVLDSLAVVGLVEEMADSFSASVTRLDDTERFGLWCALRAYTDRWRNHLDSEYAPTREDFALLERLIETIKPGYAYADLLRACSLEDYELVDRRDYNYAEIHEIATKIRNDLLAPAYGKSGLTIVNDLISRGANPRLLGTALAQLEIADSDLAVILEMLDGLLASHTEVATSYVRERQYQVGWDWVDSRSMEGWPTGRIAALFASATCGRDAWARAEFALGDNASEYWKRVSRPYHLTITSDVEYFATKMLSVGRSESALEVIALALDKRLAITTNTAFDVLENLDNIVVDTVTSFYIEETLKYLESQSPGDRLFHVECRFAEILSNTKDAYLFKHMALSAEAFVDVVAAALNGSNGGTAGLLPDIRREVAWQILINWDIVPGYTAAGTFDDRAFSFWLKKANEKSTELKCTELAESRMGHNFFHALPDANGFFIPEAIASFLESRERACAAYQAESVNSRGVYIVDRTGKQEDRIADSYDNKADSAEERGYIRFGATLRSIASEYRRMAKRHRSQAQ